MTAFGGRSRNELEQDVLASMVLVKPFRMRALPRILSGNFTTSEHVRLYKAMRRLDRLDIDDGPMFVARTLGVSLDAAEAWLMNSIVTDYDGDLERLLHADA